MELLIVSILVLGGYWVPAIMLTVIWGICSAIGGMSGTDDLY